ncbi:MAG: hypothetical protein ACUVXI_11720 [bacterium]
MALPLNVSGYLERSCKKLGYIFKRHSSNIWIIRRGRRGLSFILEYRPLTEDRGVISLSAAIMRVPKRPSPQFYRYLLEVNFDGLLHGRLAVKGDKVFLRDAFVAETVEPVEIMTSIASMEQAWESYKDDLSALGISTDRGAEVAHIHNKGKARSSPGATTPGTG